MNGAYLRLLAASTLACGPAVGACAAGSLPPPVDGWFYGRGSDDRQTRNAGIPSYDVSGVWMDVDENRAHGRDERIGIDAFDESVEFTYRLIKAMGRAK